MANEDKHVRLEVRKRLQSKEIVKRQAEIIFSGIFYGALNRNNPEEEAIYLEKKPKAIDCLKIFRSKISEDIFFDMYSFLAQLLLKGRTVSGAMTSFAYDDKLRQEISAIIESGVVPEIEETRELAKASGMILDDMELYSVIRQSYMNRYQYLCMTKVDETEFQEALDNYIDEFKKVYISEVAAIVGTITQEGGVDVEYEHRIQHLSTTEDAMNYWAEKQSFISNLGHSAAVGGYVYNSKYLRKKREEEGEDTGLFTYGIKEIDSVKKPVMRGHVIGILGPMKGGKTAFTMRTAAKLICEHLNIAIWTVDGQPLEWEAGIKAAILSNGYWNGIRIDINRADIEHNSLDTKSDAYRHLAALEAALANGELGRLSFFEGVSYAENIRSDLIQHYNILNPFDIFIMDTPLNMSSKQRKSRPEYLADGIRTIASVVREELPTKACAILTGQLKQDVIDHLRQHPEAEMDITAAADTSELVKTADQIIGIFTNKLEQSNNMTKLHDVATRHGKYFENFYCGCDLGTLRYWSDPSLNQG